MPPGVTAAAQFGADATHEAVGTSHFVVTDSEGDVVSMTTSVESIFGSGRAVGRLKKSDEEVDLIVFNPTVAEHKVPEHLVWTTGDLQSVTRAVVAVRGWHTGLFYAATFERDPEILRFVESGPLRFAAKLMGTTAMARILCIPELAVSGELTVESERYDGSSSDFRITAGAQWFGIRNSALRGAIALRLSEGAPDFEVILGYAYVF